MKLEIKVIIALIIAAILGVSHVSAYYKGKDACRQEQIEAAKTDTHQAVEQNVKRADDTAATFREKDKINETNLTHLNQSVDAHPAPANCNLSDDELRDFQNLTSTTGSVSSPSDGTVQGTESSNQP